MSTATSVRKDQGFGNLSGRTREPGKSGRDKRIGDTRAKVTCSKNKGLRPLVLLKIVENS